MSATLTFLLVLLLIHGSISQIDYDNTNYNGMLPPKEDNYILCQIVPLTADWDSNGNNQENYNDGDVSNDGEMSDSNSGGGAKSSAPGGPGGGGGKAQAPDGPEGSSGKNVNKASKFDNKRVDEKKIDCSEPQKLWDNFIGVVDEVIEQMDARQKSIKYYSYERFALGRRYRKAKRKILEFYQDLSKKVGKGTASIWLWGILAGSGYEEDLEPYYGKLKGADERDGGLKSVFGASKINDEDDQYLRFTPINAQETRKKKVWRFWIARATACEPTDNDITVKTFDSKDKDMIEELKYYDDTTMKKAKKALNDLIG